MDQNKVKGLDSFEVAETVIRSLRTKNNSLRRELQFGHMAPNQIHSKDLDQMIEKGIHQKQQEDQKLKQINEAIDRYEPTASLHSTASSATTALRDMNNNRNKAFAARQQHNNDSDDDFDSDDDHQNGKASSATGGRKATSLRQAIQHGKKYDQFANDCDFNATDKNKHIHSQQNPLDDMDDDFDNDDDEDMKEIFKDFVAPSSNNNKSRSSAQSMSSTSNKAATKKSTNADILNSTGKMGVTIKPGQAIRVKPAGGKRKQDL